MPLAVLIASLAFAAASAGRLTWRLYQEKAAPDRGYVDTQLKREAIAWLQAHPEQGALVASTDPWIVNLLTHRPAIVFPWLRDAAQARRFLVRYQPRCAILWVAELPGQPAGDAATVRQLFGPEPGPGLVEAWLPLRWRIEIARAGPHSGQLFLALAPARVASRPFDER